LRFAPNWVNCMLNARQLRDHADKAWDEHQHAYARFLYLKAHDALAENRAGGLGKNDVRRIEEKIQNFDDAAGAADAAYDAFYYSQDMQMVRDCVAEAHSLVPGFSKLDSISNKLDLWDTYASQLLASMDKGNWEDVTLVAQKILIEFPNNAMALGAGQLGRCASNHQKSINSIQKVSQDEIFHVVRVGDKQKLTILAAALKLARGRIKDAAAIRRLPEVAAVQFDARMAALGKQLDTHIASILDATATAFRNAVIARVRKADFENARRASEDAAQFYKDGECLEPKDSKIYREAVLLREATKGVLEGQMQKEDDQRLGEIETAAPVSVALVRYVDYTHRHLRGLFARVDALAKRCDWQMAAYIAKCLSEYFRDSAEIAKKSQDLIKSREAAEGIAESIEGLLERKRWSAVLSYTERTDAQDYLNDELRKSFVTRAEAGIRSSYAKWLVIGLLFVVVVVAFLAYFPTIQL
jgi:hypothetical protein